MDIIFILDVSNVILIVMGIIVTIFTGILSQRIRLIRSFHLSFISVFVFSFLLSSILFDINSFRIIVLALFLFAIIPLTISFLTVWIYTEAILDKTPSMVRVQLSSFVGWWISSSIIIALRSILGWGYTSTIALIIISLSLSILMGLFSGVIGLSMLNQSEKINPSTRK